MEKIESFKIDHLNLFPGVYVSRIDEFGGAIATTFDLRVTAPNREIPMEVPAIHTLEHLGATYLRNSEIKDRVIYFGPMGCRTGFYLVTFGKLNSEDIFEYILSLCKFVIDFDGEIPGAKPEECGNYSEQDLAKAKEYAKKYLDELKTHKRTKY